MKMRVFSKIISFVFLSIVITCSLHYLESERKDMGRESFLAKEAMKFDEHYSKPDSYIFLFFGALMLSTSIVGMYEGVAWILTKIVNYKKGAVTTNSD